MLLSELKFHREASVSYDVSEDVPGFLTFKNADGTYCFYSYIGRSDVYQYLPPLMAQAVLYELIKKDAHS